MKPDVAIAKLQELKNERERLGDELYNDDTSWKARVRSTIGQALGNDHHLVASLDDVRYTLGFWTDGTPRSAWVSAWRGGMKEAVGYIEAAIYELEAMAPPSDVDAGSYYPGLWAQVSALVEAEDWPKVASQTAIYVEDRLRTWAGHPKDNKGGELVGQVLFAQVLAEDGPLALGRQANETTGWRNLGMGFAAAISNVVRHRSQKRADWKTYAVGVLGLGSLLLTEIDQVYDTSQLGGD